MTTFIDMIFECFLLISTVLGILTIDELYKSVHKPLNDSNNNAYINPDGPLNLLHGYISYENRSIHKKRLFSPGFKINYSLTRTECQSLFKRNNIKDAVTKFKISNNEDISIYLSQYYRAARAMYNVVNGEANIHTNRDNSLFRFLTQKLNKEDSFKLLATMLLLAEGVDLPVELVKKTIDLDGSQVKPMNIQVLVYRGNDKSLLKIEIYNVIKRERRDVQGKIYIEENRRTLKEVVKLVQFFIEYGGKNKEKVEFYKLTSDDTPSFLIRSYIFEFIQNLEETQLFFKVVNDLIDHTMNGKDNEVWEKFFTKDGNKIKKCEPVYEALKTINSLILGTGFPFSDNAPPPSGMMVNGYNRKNKIEAIGYNLRFSDCCDITIYTLFCCLLYNPASRAYELDHLSENGYTLSNDLQNFFTKVCPKPEQLTSLYIHQQWTHVVQDLVLSEGELMGKEPTGSNTIEYCKKKDGVFAEIKTEILNVLKVVAKVIGMPKDKMKELGKIDAMVQSKADINKIRKKIEEYVTKIFNDISVMKIEIDINNMELLTVNNHKGFYGTTVIKFRPGCYNGGYGSAHVIQFMLKKGHAGATVISDRNEIKEEDKRILKALERKCKEMESDLGRIGMNKIHELFSQGKFKPISPETIEKVEQACSDVERYLAINKILNSRRMDTIDDKLYFIDIFAPYLNKITKDDSSDTGEQTSKETALDFINTSSGYSQEILNKARGVRKHGKKCGFRSSDPLAYLISNILGSVPLEDEVTQFFFVQIFSFCNGKYKELFPNIRCDVNIAPEFENLKLDVYPCYLLLEQLFELDIPNILNKLYNKLRKELGTSFFDNIMGAWEIYEYSYVLMVKKCIKLNCSAGIGAIKRDFRIKEEKMASGEDLLSRFYEWLDIVLTTGYSEGLEEICSIWKNLLKEETNKLGSILFVFSDPRLRARWMLLCHFICENSWEYEKYINVLLEIVLYCTYGCAHMKHVYEMFKSHFTVSLCKSLMSSLKNIVSDMNTYLLMVKDYCVKCNFKMFDEERRRVERCNKCINDLKIFINKVASCVKKRSTKFENKETFTDINICIKSIANDILELEKCSAHLKTCYTNDDDF